MVRPLREVSGRSPACIPLPPGETADEGQEFAHCADAIMSGSHPSPCISFRIASDGSAVTLIMPQGLDPDELVAADVVSLAEAQDILMDRKVVRRIEHAIDSYRKEPRDLDTVVAREVPAVDGEHGRFEWFNDYSPSLGRVPVFATDGSDRMDHYNCISYRCALAGAPVGRLIPPTAGRDGHDVTGRILRARAGKACAIKLDSCFTVDEEGRVTPTHPGLLEATESAIKVSEAFLVERSVDFSTGNIRFDGSVIVNDGIRDRFVVQATGNLVVQGLIQAAVLDCEGNFVCRQGMAGRGRGTIRVGGSAEVGYLNDMHGIIEGDLAVGRELIGCELTVGGHLVAENARLLGGETSVRYGATLGEVGARSDAPTVLAVGVRRTTFPAGTAPEEPAAERVQIDQTPAPHDEEVSVVIRRTVHAGVHLSIGGFHLSVDEALAGPLTIGRRGQGLPYCQFGDGEKHPISEVEHLTGRMMREAS
jgi:hypothetical protein